MSPKQVAITRWRRRWHRWHRWRSQHRCMHRSWRGSIAWHRPASLPRSAQHSGARLVHRRLRHVGPAGRQGTARSARVIGDPHLCRNVCCGSMLSKKSILADEQDFSAPLVGPMLGIVRDHIESQQNDHRPSYMPYRGLRRPRQLKPDLCEIFGAPQFSTFSTVSTPRRRRGTSLSVVYSPGAALSGGVAGTGFTTP